MSLRVKVITIICLVLCLFLIINMVRKRTLELKYVLLWIGCDLALILAFLFPSLIGIAARFLGIASPMNMIFFLGFVFSLIIIFSLTVALSRETARVRKLAQEIALFEEESRVSDQKKDTTSETR